MFDRPDTKPFFPDENDVIVSVFSWDTLPPEDGRFVSLRSTDGSFLTPGLVTGLHGTRSSNTVIGHVKCALARQGTLQNFTIKASELIIPIPKTQSLTYMMDRIDALSGPLVNLKRLKAKAVKQIMGLCTQPPAKSADFLPRMRDDPAGFFLRFFSEPTLQGVQVVYWDCPGAFFKAGLSPTELFSVATVRQSYLRTLRSVLPPRNLLSDRARFNVDRCLEELKSKFILK